MGELSLRDPFWRSEYLITSQSLNLTHTYVNNIKNVCNIVHLVFFRACLILHFNFPNNTSTKLSSQKNGTPRLRRAPCTCVTQGPGGRRRCPRPSYHISPSAGHRTPFLLLRCRLVSPVILSQLFLFIFGGRFIASFPNKDISTVCQQHHLDILVLEVNRRLSTGLTSPDG